MRRNRGRGNGGHHQIGEIPSNLTGEKYSTEVGYSAGKALSLTSITGFIADIKSKKALTLNLNRAYLLIQNQSAGVIYINFGVNANANGGGIKVEAGGFFEPFKAPLDSVYILGSADDLQVSIMESIGRSKEFEKAYTERPR